MVAIAATMRALATSCPASLISFVQLRTCVDRLAGDGEHTIATEMAEVDCKGLHRVEVRDRHGKVSEAVLELKFRRILVQPPLYKQRRYPALELTVWHATERGKPRDLANAGD